MLGLDRRAARIAWTVFLVSLMIGAVYAMRKTLMIFVIALFFAYMLTPLVDFVARFVPQKVSRTTTLLLVYIAMMALLITGAVLLGTKIGEEATGLATKLPQMLQRTDIIDNMMPSWLAPYHDKILNSLRGQMQNLDQEVLPMLQSAGERILLGLGNVLTIILVPILSFFFLKDGPVLRQHMLDSFTNENNRKMLEDILNDVHELLAKYIRALFLLSSATFLSYTIFLSILGVPYAILLSVIAAILEFIPVVGPLLAAAIVLLVAGFTGFPHLLWIVFFCAAYRLFQDYVLSPYLMSSGVEVPPLLVLFGVLAGEQIAGVPGMFFSVPVIAILRVILVRIEREQRRRQIVEPRERLAGVVIS